MTNVQTDPPPANPLAGCAGGFVRAAVIVLVLMTVTDDDIRAHLMAGLHGRCLVDWALRHANGAVAITKHDVEAHRDVAAALVPVVRELAQRIADGRTS